MFRAIKTAVPVIFFVLSISIGTSYGVDTDETIENCGRFLSSCDYYLCQERNRGCGEEGYLKRLGYPYCSRLTTDLTERLSQEGVAWLLRAAQCLRDTMDLEPWVLRCDELEVKAIDSHRGCYVGTGFCNVSLADKFEIFGAVHQTLIDKRMLKVLLEIVSDCAMDFRVLLDFADRSRFRGGV